MGLLDKLATLLPSNQPVRFLPTQKELKESQGTLVVKGNLEVIGHNDHFPPRSFAFFRHKGYWVDLGEVGDVLREWHRENDRYLLMRPLIEL